MRGSDFLRIADLLAADDSEAAMRTRIGRFYYAAYLEARTFCEIQLGYERTTGGREHQDVARHIRSVDVEIADWLFFLRGIRNTADYDLAVNAQTLRRDLRDIAVTANTIIARLDALSPGA